MYGMPTPHVIGSGKWHIAGCEPDFPKHIDWGCCNCNAAFFKDTQINKAALGVLVPWQCPKD